MSKKILVILSMVLMLFSSCSKKQEEVASEQQDGETIQRVRTVEVVSVEYARGVSSRDAASLKARIIEGLSNRRNIRVIDRSRLDDVLNEHQMQQSLWASQDDLAEVGQQYNANAYVYLEVISKDEILVTIEDVNTFQQVVKVVTPSTVSEIKDWDLSILSL